MPNHLDDLLLKITTFRFTSGQLLTLNQDQIEKIPYLSALVSSGDWFESARDGEGNLQLDPCINYEDFIHILSSLRFYSVRHLFTTLPKETNVIPIIYLFDFLGLGPQVNPTLKEVDSTFFSTVVYNPVTQKHSRIFEPSVIQDIAVQFSVAIVKEEYDFSKNEVIDHVYWLIMFILSAWKYFGPRLRQHVHTIATNCFTVFKPSQLESLKKLKQRTDYDTKRRTSLLRESRSGCHPLYFFQLENAVLQFDYLEQDHDDYTCIQRMLSEKDRTYTYPNRDSQMFFWSHKKLIEEDLLKPVCDHVLEIIYAQLQDQICQRTLSVLRDDKQPKDESERMPGTIFEGLPSFLLHYNNQMKYSHTLGRYIWPLSSLFHRFNVLPDAIGDLFENEHVQQEIRELLLKELPILIPKLKQKHVEIQKKLQSLESQQNNDNEHLVFFYVFWGGSRRSEYESVQQETLIHALLLDKLDHSSDIVVTQAQQLVSKSLYNAALKQLNQWLNTQDEIKALRAYPTTEGYCDDSSSKLSKKTYQRYRMPVPKPVPKHQLKYSRR